MADHAVGFEITPDTSGIRAETDAMRKRLRDLSPVMEGRAQAFQAMTKRDVFNAEQSPLGEAWQPLAQATVDAKRKGSAKILTDTGALQNAIASRATSGGIMVGISGAPATYGPTHQFGRPQGRGKIPARPFLPIDEAGIVVSTSGPMKTFMSRTLQRVRDFIMTGQV
ncbi:phage virion morphogenesis protein [bacterium]|nr:phage virion morphogenesis protein [bacterium]